MRTASLLALLVAMALVAAPAWAAPGPDSPGRSGRSGDDVGASDDGNTTGSTGPGNSSGRGSSGGGRGGDMNDLQQEQRAERDAFRAEMDAKRDDCRALPGDERGACERALRDELKAFQDEQRLAFEAARELLERGAPEDRLGAFSLDGDDFSGKFVSFQLDLANGTVLDYTVGGCLLFTSIHIAGLAGADATVREHGRVVQVQADDARVRLHDNPGGVFTIGDGNLTFTLDGGVAAQLAGNGSRLNLTACDGAFNATLRAKNLTQDGSDWLGQHHATFVAHDEDPAAPESDAVEASKGRGHVGAEVTVVGDDDEDVAEVEFEDGLALETERADNGVRVVVNGTGIGPKTVLVHLAPGLLKGDRVVVRYFDESAGTFTEAALTPADSKDDVLDPEDDSGPEYWLDPTPEGLQVLVSIDSWSTHAFTVQGFLVDVPPSVVAGLLGGVLLVAVAGAGLVRRKR